MRALHHVQVSGPPGSEDVSREFWVAALGLTEVVKPEPMRSRGGCWFLAHDDAGAVTLEIHLGIEQDFRPALKAHPALLVDDLDDVAASLLRGGHPVDDSERDTLDGYVRLHTNDPLGNRVEILQRLV